MSDLLVGVAGFEPATPSSRTRCATRLRYTPKAAAYSVASRPASSNSGLAEPAVHWRRLSSRRTPYWVLLNRAACALSCVRADPAVVERDLLRRGDQLALAALQHADELGGLEQRVVGSGIEPGEAAAEPLDRRAAPAGHRDC